MLNVATVFSFAIDCREEEKKTYPLTNSGQIIQEVLRILPLKHVSLARRS